MDSFGFCGVFFFVVVGFSLFLLFVLLVLFSST